MPIYPPAFPHDLHKNPKLRGEYFVYSALESALTDTWHIFYNLKVPGTQRRIDFLCVDPCRGVAAFEVKGGILRQYGRAFYQVAYGQGFLIKISPSNQLNTAVSEVLKCGGIDETAFKLEQFVFGPQMSQEDYDFAEETHWFTKEDREPARLRNKLEERLPMVSDASATAAIQSFLDKLLGWAARRRTKRVFYRRYVQRTVDLTDGDIAVIEASKMAPGIEHLNGELDAK